ncbi:hypothetical protein HMPREF0650_0694 [Hoylesella buccalis ATCC 35310]|uniref:Type 9 secretion system plug protein N-terminal domain-containing protein n=1 Tax=Hoylesella buccalis ATCC 35310 TaxID=679190 RepID=D1W2S4_9BACT|nr:hypothetical protein HMPREF0650_0694 [Hoylesella buccalis ATCC 35310]
MEMNTINRALIGICLLLAASVCTAQKNEIYKKSIASLQVVAGDDWLSPPITQLDGEPITIAFDDLTHEYHRYTYTIEHCEADWSTTTQLFASDYLDGFAEGNTIDDVQKSINTKTLYTHYRLQIPNERCRLKMSGNYRLTVFDENNDNEKILSACFMVVEPLAGIQMEVVTNTDIDINGTHQQVNMEVNYGMLQVTDPATQIKTIVLQNGRWNKERFNIKPQYVMPDALKWVHNKQLIFDGGNEYRKFEMLDVNHTTMGLESVNWDGNDYHAYVWTDEPRPNYVYDEDANGTFYIRNSDNVENNTSSDYLIVHFKLQTPRQNGDVYLNATWTNDQLTPEYKMHYNEQDGVYEAAVLLKQGYYSYQYVVAKTDGTTAPVSTEGSFYQTENKYQALLYYRGTGERTDRLVGYQHY